MWKKIEGYENYLINNKGIVKRILGIQCQKERILKSSMLGKFGKNHNQSKGFTIKDSFDNYTFYGSGLEFTRITGLDHSSISWARKHKQSGYKFSKGRKLEGLTVYFEIIE